MISLHYERFIITPNQSVINCETWDDNPIESPLADEMKVKLESLVLLSKQINKKHSNYTIELQIEYKINLSVRTESYIKITYTIASYELKLETIDYVVFPLSIAQSIISKTDKIIRNEIEILNRSKKCEDYSELTIDYPLYLDSNEAFKFFYYILSRAFEKDVITNRRQLRKLNFFKGNLSLFENYNLSRTEDDAGSKIKRNHCIVFQGKLRETTIGPTTGNMYIDYFATNRKLLPISKSIVVDVDAHLKNAGTFALESYPYLQLDKIKDIKYDFKKQEFHINVESSKLVLSNTKEKYFKPFIIKGRLKSLTKSRIFRAGIDKRIYLLCIKSNNAHLVCGKVPRLKIENLDMQVIAGNEDSLIK